MIGTGWLLSNGPLRKGGPLRVGLEAGTSKKKKRKGASSADLCKNIPSSIERLCLRGTKKGGKGCSLSKRDGMAGVVGRKSEVGARSCWVLTI